MSFLANEKASVLDGFLSMKDKNYYRKLPGSMSVGDIHAEFYELVEFYEQGVTSASEFLSAAAELSDRQWHTYTLLEASLTERVEKALLRTWDSSVLTVVECVLSIAATLGLVGLFQYIASLNLHTMRPEIAEEISAALFEFGNTLGDPYSGM